MEIAEKNYKLLFCLKGALRIIDEFRDYIDPHKGYNNTYNSLIKKVDKCVHKCRKAISEQIKIGGYDMCKTFEEFKMTYGKDVITHDELLLMFFQQGQRLKAKEYEIRILDNLCESRLKLIKGLTTAIKRLRKEKEEAI